MRAQPVEFLTHIRAGRRQRCLSRKALSELGMRVLFQMSANDSASLIDSPKAGSLGLNRALFYSEHESRMEVFRPFALPGVDWVNEIN